jgi:hypothetical protein
VRLGNHWTAGCKGGPEVVSEHAEGKGEVACAENGDRAEWLVDPGQAGRGAGRAVDRGSEVRTLGGDVAVEAQLTGRARYLRCEARVTQSGLYLGQFDQFRGVRHQCHTDRVEPTAPLPWVGCRHGRASVGRALDGSPDLVRGHLLDSPVRVARPGVV